LRNIVTGGAGFIGSHLIDNLIINGQDVICIDNFSTGLEKNIEHWINNSKFKLINHDIINPIELEADRIWHLACPASISEYQKDPIKTSKINFIGTLNMLELARKSEAKFLLASSSEVYGDPTEHPQKENYWGSVNSIGVRSCYDEGKRFAESLTFDFARTFNLDIKIARIFNTYGPRIKPHDGRVISNFISQALQKEQFTIYGDGTQTRSFCFITDLINGLTKLMNSKYKGPVNLGNPEEINILNLASLINDKVGNKFKLIYYSLPENDPSRRKPDITLAKSSLFWSPKINLSEGINQTIHYFKENNLS
jgi:UDP-glucuronate decarboxylase